MPLAAMELDVPQYQIAVRLFGAIDVMVVSQNLTDLVHQFQFRVGFKFWIELGFHVISYSI
jgi:hypothetical protein